jgi:hypothetical protein
VTVADALTIIAGARRGGDPEFTYLVPGRARPVLILNDPPTEHHAEITALRLLRLSKIEVRKRERVRRHHEPLLFHLQPERYDLPEESAAIVCAVVRVHLDAVDLDSLGELNPNELRALGERIIESYRFDTRNLVERQIRELVARQRAQEG